MAFYIKFPYFLRRRQDIGGTGADGYFHPLSNTTLTGANKNYTGIYIPAGVTVLVDPGVKILSQGDVTIDGTLSSAGRGYTGGNGAENSFGLTSPGAGSGPKGGSPGFNVSAPYPNPPLLAGDGGNAGNPSNPTVISTSVLSALTTHPSSTGNLVVLPPNYDTTTVVLETGSGGGGGGMSSYSSDGLNFSYIQGGDGGRGSGPIWLETPGTVLVGATGSIYGRGNNGQLGADDTLYNIGTREGGDGGRGGDGSLMLRCGSINADALLNFLNGYILVQYV